MIATLRRSDQSLICKQQGSRLARMQRAGRNTDSEWKQCTVSALSSYDRRSLGVIMDVVRILAPAYSSFPLPSFGLNDDSTDLLDPASIN